MAGGSWGAPGVIFAAMLAIAAPTSAQNVDRFLMLSRQFQAQLSSPATAGLNRDQERFRAVCILSRFETDHGAPGLAALMGLMDVLSKGTEFDDATVVAFNERYGPSYSRVTAMCTAEARGS